MQATNGLPIGSVIAYAGDLSILGNVKALNEAGYLLCDGTLYSRDTYPDLFAAIGLTNGGDASSQNFNVPDLRDRFMRGRDDANNRDPDTNSRTAANSGGAAGNNVGSLQDSGTALPTTNPLILSNDGSHAHTVSHLTGHMYAVSQASDYTMDRYTTNEDTDVDGIHNHSLTLSGYATATAPVNMALYFIIKASQPTSGNGIIPAGVMIGYTGVSSYEPPNWFLCDGASKQNNGEFQTLFKMLSYNYGGDGQTIFAIPDLRGLFLRCTDHGRGRDPGATNRSALSVGGAVGDVTGSLQGYATSLPVDAQIQTTGAHTHNINKIPQDSQAAAIGAPGSSALYTMEWTDDDTTSTLAGDHTHTAIGGDKETRPVNLYFDWLIASENLLDNPPIGCILPIGGDTTILNNRDALIQAGWLPCDGSKLRIDDPIYNALFVAIGKTYGSDILNFFTPDLCGYFIMGAGGSQMAGAVLPQSQTGAPINPISMSTDAGSHSHNFSNIPKTTDGILYTTGVNLAQNNPDPSPTSSNGDHTHALSGGDQESRPINVYVDYIIRYR